mgnify:CR=1 FL=1
MQLIMKEQIVKFVIDKKLDIVNHFIGLDSYKRNIERGFQQPKNEKYEKLLKLNKVQQNEEIENNISRYYKDERKLNSLADDINNEWIKIEGDFIKKLEDIHKNPFHHKNIRGVLSSGSRFGYKVDEEWFATDMFRNKFMSIDVATHELMHFMFHGYYENTLKEKGLSENVIWDIKESFTVLLNLEFDDFRFQPDHGYPPHKNLREVIEKSWNKEHDFNTALELAIKSVVTDK